MSFRGSRLKTVPITASASGDNTIVAGLPGRKIAVTSFVIVASGVVTVQWKSAATNLSGVMSLGANAVLPMIGSDDAPLFVTQAAGNALVLTLGGAVAVGGFASYIVLPFDS